MMRNSAISPAPTTPLAQPSALANADAHREAGEGAKRQAPVQGSLPLGFAIGQQVKVLANARPVYAQFVGMLPSACKPQKVPA